MLTIVIPCFNEFENLKKILKRIEYFSKDNNNVFFIIVDNGSTDQTKDFLHKYKKNNQISFCFVKKNIGYGHGILSGLKIASTEFLGWTHSDNPKNIDDIFYCIEKYKNLNEETFYKGIRTLKRPLFDIIFSYGLNLISSILLRKFLWEITAQPTIFSKKFYSHFYHPPEDFCLDLFCIHLARKNKLKFKRFKLEYKERIKGKSKWNTGFLSKIKLSLRYLKYIFTLI